MKHLLPFLLAVLLLFSGCHAAPPAETAVLQETPAPTPTAEAQTPSPTPEPVPEALWPLDAVHWAQSSGSVIAHGEYIAFALENALLLADAEGSGCRVLAQGLTSHALWSREGMLLCQQNDALCLIEPDDTVRTVPDTEYPWLHALLPDGSVLYHGFSDTEGMKAIFLQSPDGTVVKAAEYPNHMDFLVEDTWCDGQWYYYVTLDSRWEVVPVNERPLVTVNRICLETHAQEEYAHLPSFSHTVTGFGRQLYYLLYVPTKDDAVYRTHLYRYTPGTEETALVSEDVSLYFFAENGLVLAFSDAEADPYVYLLSPDGTKTPIFSLKTDFGEWSCRRVLGVAGNQLLTMNMDGSFTLTDFSDPQNCVHLPFSPP